MPAQAFRACEVLQTWRSFLPDPTAHDLASYAHTGVDGTYAYRNINWLMDCMDPTALSVSKSNMRFNHYTTIPSLDDVTTVTSNADVVELPGNWISMAKEYRECRVEAVKVEQILSIAPGSPPLFVAEWWSDHPIEGSRNYAYLKQLPGIKFRFINGVLPNTNAGDNLVKRTTGVNPHPTLAAEVNDPKEDFVAGKATVIRLSSYRRAKTYFKGSNTNRKFLTLTGYDLYEGTNLRGHTYTPNYSDFSTEEIGKHQWFYHCQVGVADPSIGFPAINCRAMLKITFFTQFKTLRAAISNSLRYNVWLPDRLTLTLHTATEEGQLVDDDNLSSSQTAFLANHAKNVLPRRGVLFDHGEEIRTAWNLDPFDDQYEGGHPWLMKEVGTFTNAGGDDNAQWADGEMADGTNLVADALDTTAQLTPVLVDIRHDAAGGFSNLPTGMTASELSAYLLDHD